MIKIKRHFEHLYSWSYYLTFFNIPGKEYHFIFVKEMAVLPSIFILFMASNMYSKKDYVFDIKIRELIASINNKI